MTLNARSQAVGYAAALVVPVGITYAVAWLGWPAFIFEHLVVLLVVVIALHGGTIEAAPAEARGTIVTVRLPLARVQREERVAAPRAQPVSI
jgi:hypothetical protein